VAKFLIRENGPLHGEVTISGSKNAMLPIMAATLLTDGKCQIMDVPRLRDVDVMCNMLRRIGADVQEDYDNNTLYMINLKTGQEEQIIKKNIESIQVDNNIIYYKLLNTIGIYKYDIETGKGAQITSARTSEFVCIN